MNCLWQRSWHMQVQRRDENLVCFCHYLDTIDEIRAELLVRVGDYTIQEARLIKLGKPGHYSEDVIAIPELKGIAAYPGSGPQLRKILEPLLSSEERELINQCIIGAFQAETFVYQERGFTSAKEYSQAGDEYLKDTCSYYSNLDRISAAWMEYIGDSLRREYLFDRFKTQHLLTTGEEYWLIGSLNDSFHQVSTVLQLAKSDQRIKAAWGELLKAPDKVCKEASNYVQNLIGINIAQISKKELTHRLGAQYGCVHLIDTIFDSGETLRLYLQKSSAC